MQAPADRRLILPPSRRSFRASNFANTTAAAAGREGAMPDLGAALRDLVAANHILAHEGIVDAYGHISMRHPERPDRFFLAAGCSPETVTLDDIREYDLECKPVVADGHPMYVERPIHGAIFQHRPDVHSVIHNHAHEVIPFSVAKAVKLRPVFITAAAIGAEIPVWDSRDKFSDVGMLVTTMAQGRDLAACLNRSTVALMRGHGSVVTAKSIYDAVHTAVLLRDNAKIQTEAMRFGDVTYLDHAEITKSGGPPQGPNSRAWKYWLARCGEARRGGENR
jgi:ribulose-5-phosphate 4-epimerase/fuculose-1-phosphate aldolase